MNTPPHQSPSQVYAPLVRAPITRLQQDDNAGLHALLTHYHSRLAESRDPSQQRLAEELYQDYHKLALQSAVRCSLAQAQPFQALGLDFENAGEFQTLLRRDALRKQENQRLLSEMRQHREYMRLQPKPIVVTATVVQEANTSSI